MILYLSHGTDRKLFAEYVKRGDIDCLHQAQKFNSLLIEGISLYEPIISVANPGFRPGSNLSIPTKSIVRDNARYICMGNHPGRFHKFWNYSEMRNTSERIIRQNTITAIVSDAINPLASCIAIQLGWKYRIPAVAIITDLPTFDQNIRKNFFSKIDMYYMVKFNGFVLLTEAMGEVINRNRRPMIIMEGVCDSELGRKEAKNNKCNRIRICMYCGTLSRENGIDILMDGFSRARLDNWELHIYGKGPIVDEVKKVVSNYDSIRYCGILPNDEIVKKEEEADLLISPRLPTWQVVKYSFPSKLMEYMASGTPVLTTKLNGIPSEYNNYLYFIDEANVEGICLSLTRFNSLPREECIKKGSDAQKFVLDQKNKYIQARRILDLTLECEINAD